MSTEFFENYRHKLLQVSEIEKLIGPFPRKSKAILCHGVFDVVHPGHVRHLAYAKSKAEILIASVTADRFIKKGIYRPHIPEDLRALNLAAFEMVDYVMIDEYETPIETLKNIKPDFFAKGFEYTSTGLPPATMEEAEIVKGYGGEMVFTPGDVVYSSSKIIDSSLPQVQMEKLLLLMERNGVSFENLRDTVRNLDGYHIHVVGDTIVDAYTRTTLIGGQTKTPTFSVLYQGEDKYIGGAGIVAQHLRAAGAEVTFSTVLGSDNLKDFVVKGLTESGIRVNPIIDEKRPTTKKNAIISDAYRLLKIDTLDNSPISEEILLQLLDLVKKIESDSIVFSDFRHGIFNRLSVPVLSDSIPINSFKVADSQVASRWGNIIEFKDFDLITPNEREARFALANQDSGVGRLASFIAEACRCKNLILKLGDRGVFCSTHSYDPKSTHFSIESFVSQVVDAVGAGDALLAYATLAMLKTKSLLKSSIIGSMAAACECELDGNVPVQPSNVISKINFVEKMSSYTKK